MKSKDFEIGSLDGKIILITLIKRFKYSIIVS